jgi:phytoene synthase
MASALSPLGALVRRHDPDRFLTALFAPPGHRETLFVLYALNHELARAREAASEPTLALIRLHWWREVADGARRRHEVAGPLGEALDAGRLDASDLRGLIDAREAEADPAIPSLAAWRGYVLATAGGLAAAAGRALGADAAARARLRALGAAYGAAGILRSIAPLARQGMCRLPEDLLGAHGLTVHAVLADPAGAALAPVRAALAAQGRAWLGEGAGPLPRPVLAAGLVATLARRDLRRAVPAPRSLGDRLAVLAAAVAGRP